MFAAWRALGARYDTAALQPFEWPASGGAGPDWPALREWCTAQPALRFAVARVGPGEGAAARAAAVALKLDGSVQLQAAHGALGRFAMRLRVKLHDMLGGLAATRSCIWDSGWVPPEPSAWAALMQFKPRRPTLIVMQGLPPGAVQRLLVALQSRSAGFLRPVRVLLIDPARGDMAAEPPTVLALPSSLSATQ